MSIEPRSDEDNRYDPYSYDAVLSKIVTRLDGIHTKLDEFTEEHRESNNILNKRILEVESTVNNRLDALEIKVNERMKDLEKRVVSLEYYKFYIAGMIAVASAAAGYIFNKIFNPDK